MAPLRSLGNILSAFDDFYARTGKDAVTPPIISSGGTKVEDANYVYHVFTHPNSDTFTSDTAVPAFYLVVAGGGTGGSNSGGGGGAGGAYSNHPDVPAPLRQSALNITAGTTYPITVGNAGANSAIGPSVITATAGGTGGNTEGDGSSGGSGGGGGNNYTDQSTTAGSASPPGQGNPGGRQIAPAPGSSGGGGGGGWSEAGYSTGNASPTPKRGHGGDGLALPSLPAPILAPAIPAPERSAWTAAVGPTGLFAGGGGGHVDFADGPNPDNGGAGGGGHGQNPQNATGETPGVYGTGGGGGGGTPSGQPGGSGIVIIWYPKP